MPNRQHQIATIMLIAAMLLLPVSDAIAKRLTTSIFVGEITLWRFMFQTLLLLPLALRLPDKFFSANTPIQILLGTMMALTSILFFAGLKFLPMADNLAIFFVQPLLVTLCAVLFLQERIGWHRLFSIMAGLFGSLLIIRPNFEQFGWTAALPLGAALTFSVYILLSRNLSQKESPITIQFRAGLYGSIASAIMLIIATQFDLITPTPTLNAITITQCGLLFCIGLITCSSHLLIVYAYKHAPVSLLAPFQYTEILGAITLGLLIFNDFPDTLTWCGIIIIVTSGLYMFYREHRLSKA